MKGFLLNSYDVSIVAGIPLNELSVGLRQDSIPFLKGFTGESLKVALFGNADQVFTHNLYIRYISFQFDRNLAKLLTNSAFPHL